MKASCITQVGDTEAVLESITCLGIVCPAMGPTWLRWWSLWAHGDHFQLLFGHIPANHQPEFLSRRPKDCVYAPSNVTRGKRDPKWGETEFEDLVQVSHRNCRLWVISIWEHLLRTGIDFGRVKTHINRPYPLQACAPHSFHKSDPSLFLSFSPFSKYFIFFGSTYVCLSHMQLPLLVAKTHQGIWWISGGFLWCLTLGHL